MTFHFPSQHHAQSWGGPSAPAPAISKELAHSALEFLSYHDISHPRKADQIQPGIYLGDLVDALNHQAIEDKKITHVLTIFSNCPELELPSFVQHKVVAASDDPNDALLDHFQECWRFINNAVNDLPSKATPHDYHTGKILIHCEQGISRSATVLAAYLMKEERLHSQEAINYIRRFRPIIDPNPGFKEQLHIWGQCRGELKGKVEYTDWKRKHIA